MVDYTIYLKVRMHLRQSCGDCGGWELVVAGEHFGSEFKTIVISLAQKFDLLDLISVHNCPMKIEF